MTDIQSASTASIFAALVAVQARIDNVVQDREVEVPIKDKQNAGQFKGKYKYRYATLPGILNHIREAMTENGLWYAQRVEDRMMVTRLFHTSGEWMDAGHLPIPDIKGSPQDVGSIVSYFKRYSLTAAVGLAAEDDGDGEMGDREVSFRPSGRQDPEVVEVDEPPMGWGDWCRGLIATIEGKESTEELDDVRDANKRYINSVKKVDAVMHNDIAEAFRKRRAVVGNGGI